MRYIITCIPIGDARCHVENVSKKSPSALKCQEDFLHGCSITFYNSTDGQWSGLHLPTRRSGSPINTDCLCPCFKGRPHGQSFINHKLELSSNSPKIPVQTINLLFDFCVCVIDKLCFSDLSWFRFCSKASNKSLTNIVNFSAFQFLVLWNFRWYCNILVVVYLTSYLDRYYCNKYN